MKRCALVVMFALSACGSHPPPPVKTADFTGVHVEDATVASYVTLVDFWSESCGACIVVADKNAAALAHQDRVIVRKVNVGDSDTPVAKAYDVSALPHWNVYDKKRRLRFILVGPDCLRAPTLAAELLAEP